jgi:hypothetical protein
VLNIVRKINKKSSQKMKKKLKIIGGIGSFRFILKQMLGRSKPAVCTASH